MRTRIDVRPLYKYLKTGGVRLHGTRLRRVHRERERRGRTPARVRAGKHQQNLQLRKLGAEVKIKSS